MPQATANTSGAACALASDLPAGEAKARQGGHAQGSASTIGNGCEAQVERLRKRPGHGKRRSEIGMLSWSHEPAREVWPRLEINRSTGNCDWGSASRSWQESPDNEPLGLRCAVPRIGKGLSPARVLSFVMPRGAEAWPFLQRGRSPPTREVEDHLSPRGVKPGAE